MMIFTKDHRYIIMLIGSLLTLAYGRYQPSIAVQSAHNIPHSYNDLQVNIHSKSYLSHDYMSSLIVFPAVMLGIGFVAILIFCTLWLFRCISTYLCRRYSCIQCIPDDSQADSMNDDELQQLRQKVASSRRLIIGSFLSFIFLGILSSQAILIGNSYLTKGVSKEHHALTEANDFFHELIDYSGGIHSTIQSMVTIMDVDPCVQMFRPFLGDIFSTLNEVKDISHSMEKNLITVAQYTADVEGYLTDYGNHTKDVILYSSYAGFMSLLLLFLSSYYYRSALMTKILCVFTIVVVTSLTITLSLETTVIMFLGDICIDPTANIMKLIPDSQIQEIASFYTTCQGANPLLTKLQNTSNYINAINTQYDEIKNFTYLCPAGSNLQAIEPYLSILTYDAANLLQQTDCTAIHDAWNVGINQGLCQYLFNGLFTLWIGQYILSGSLFMTMCFGVVLYGYYGHLWHVSVDDEGPYQSKSQVNQATLYGCVSKHNHVVDVGEVVKYCVDDEFGIMMVEPEPVPIATRLNTPQDSMIDLTVLDDASCKV